MYMEIASIAAKYSYAKRLQVGSIIVRGDRILSVGINGMPVGWIDNVCEEIDSNGVEKSKEEVLHSEANALSKLARSTDTGEGATLFTTHSPCLQCAKLIVQTGIVEVYYKHKYRNLNGIHFLEKCGIKVTQISI